MKFDRSRSCHREIGQVSGLSRAEDYNPEYYRVKTPWAPTVKHHDAGGQLTISQNVHCIRDEIS